MTLTASFKDWLFRWRSDGTAPIVLTQRRIFILPTKAGLLFSAVLVVMLIGAINYNLALGHALVFLLAGLGITGMMHCFRNLAGLTIYGGRTEAVFVGETAHFPLHLANDRESPRLALEFRAGDGASVVCDLLPKSQSCTELPLPATRRGWLELPRVRLSTRFPLGLFEAWSYPQPAMRCLVYPRPLYLPLPELAAVASIGEQRGDAGQEDFAGLRERQPADSPRHVAWKAVARDFENRPLLVKQFSGGAQNELWLDWRDASLTGVDIETRIAILAGWVLSADNAGVLYGLRLPSVDFEPAQGSTHQQRCLETLALFSPP